MRSSSMIGLPTKTNDLFEARLQERLNVQNRAAAAVGGSPASQIQGNQNYHGGLLN